MTKLTQEQAAARAIALLDPTILRDEVSEMFLRRNTKALYVSWEFLVEKYGELDDCMISLARVAGVLAMLWYASGSVRSQVKDR